VFFGFFLLTALPFQLFLSLGYFFFLGRARSHQWLHGRNADLVDFWISSGLRALS
jgi:hypothetical protein